MPDATEPTPEMLARSYGLTCLRLIRQLDRDNPVRQEACDLLYRTGFIGPASPLRIDEEDEPSGRRCPKCGSAMGHYRLHGYRCFRGCSP
jgi:hypothetical protein